MIGVDLCSIYASLTFSRKFSLSYCVTCTALRNEISVVLPLCLSVVAHSHGLDQDLLARRRRGRGRCGSVQSRCKDGRHLIISLSFCFYLDKNSPRAMLFCVFHLFMITSVSFSVQVDVYYYLVYVF